MKYVFKPYDIEVAMSTVAITKYFLDTLNEYINDHSVTNRASMRRASMELTRQLAFLRKQPYNS